MSDSSYGSGITKYGGAISTTDSMTLSGTVNKTGILLVLAVASAFFTWNQFAATHNPASVSLEMIVGVFGGLIFALITTFKREWAPVTAPIYALLEGLFLGAFSSIIDLRYPGIAIQAVGLRASIKAHPNLWNGTVRSASWSPSSGFTSKSSVCYPSSAAATRRIGKAAGLSALAGFWYVNKQKGGGLSELSRHLLIARKRRLTEWFGVPA
jgi:hypothetical protein